MTNESRPGLKDYERWRAANNEQFSLNDYAYGVMFNQGVPADAVLALAELVWPRFTEIDGLILLAEQFDRDKLTDLRSREHLGSELEF